MDQTNHLHNTINKIVNISACDPKSEGEKCPYCGTLIPPMPIDVPNLGIKSYVQPVCKCVQIAEAKRLKEAEDYQKNKDIERLFSVSRDVGEKFNGVSINSFRLREGSELAFKVTKKYIENFNPNRVSSFLIWGDVGNGKTHLAASVAHALKEEGYSVVFQKTSTLLQRIRNTFNKSEKETEREITRAILDCDLLILDELGKDKVTDWVEDIFYELIDGRYVQNKPIFITSNLGNADLEMKIGKRSYSRIEEMCVFVENKGSSVRKERAKEKQRRVLEELEND